MREKSRGCLPRATFTWKLLAGATKKHPEPSGTKTRKHMRTAQKERFFQPSPRRRATCICLTPAEQGLHFHSRVKDLAASAAVKYNCARKKWKTTPSACMVCIAHVKKSGRGHLTAAGGVWEAGWNNFHTVRRRRAQQTYGHQTLLFSLSCGTNTHPSKRQANKTHLVGERAR